jgi:hypothetical protein
MQGAAPGTPAARERELRLDVFRGLAMFIILLAHTPNNTWTLWIPARFGFSDATEIFVFCSGFASAMAFGTVFARKGWLVGIGRIAYRIWQVYWCHIGVFLAACAILFAIDHFGLGAEGRRAIERPYVVPFFEDTGRALIGLLTLTYVPGLFDILPMYLVILAMIPAVVAIQAWGGTRAAAVAVIGLWAVANLAGLARLAGREEEVGALVALIAPLGEPFRVLNLPSHFAEDHVWFFNPFGWQLIFFTGFAFGRGWLPAPPVTRTLVLAAAAVVVLSLPLAWHKLYSPLVGYLPEGALSEGLFRLRETIEPLRWKSWQGPLRALHFFAVAYLAWVAVGAGGRRLREGFPTPPAPGRRVMAGAGVVAVLTLPYGYIEELGALMPALMAAVPEVPFRYLGLLQLLHLAALVVLVWGALPAAARVWATRRAPLHAVPVIRKVGTQSLAVFVVSIPLAVTNGWLLDIWGADVWTRAAVNLTGFGVLIATAYAAGWFRSQPWRDRGPRRKPEGGLVVDEQGGSLPPNPAAAPAGGRERGPDRLAPST